MRTWCFRRWAGRIRWTRGAACGPHGWRSELVAGATGVPAGGDWGSQFSRFVFLESDPAVATRRFGWVNGVGILISNDRGAWASSGHAASGPDNTGFSEVQALDARDGQVLVCGRPFGDSFAKI